MPKNWANKVFKGWPTGDLCSGVNPLWKLVGHTIFEKMTTKTIAMCFNVEILAVHYTWDHHSSIEDHWHIFIGTIYGLKMAFSRVLGELFVNGNIMNFWTLRFPSNMNSWFFFMKRHLGSFCSRFFENSVTD